MCAMMLLGRALFPLLLSPVPQQSQARRHQHKPPAWPSAEKHSISGCEERDFFFSFGRSGSSLCNLLWLRWMATGARVFGLASWNGRRVEHDGCQVPSLQEHGVLPRSHFPNWRRRLARSKIITFTHAISTWHPVHLTGPSGL
ncbi:hypothetical protein QBC32DRAFT_150524 [Pseudoneurospora amorphoporcata]|uniref:Secreted protein n=1 Tax=Pseudoneurospora amorphoporcata TaxID=241081 RepID=A0AAN6NW53_9PEZI|nr:hypothetical protein QBC32DRAFT_150524 [Pseudoneurospora amorphoporcata]